MTRKDYDLIAEAIRTVRRGIALDREGNKRYEDEGFSEQEARDVGVGVSRVERELIRHLGIYNEEDNPLFDAEKFHKACVPEE